MPFWHIVMDRFEWGDTNLVPGEEQVNFQTGIAIYDGQDKVNAKYLSWNTSKDKIRTCVCCMYKKSDIY